MGRILLFGGTTEGKQMASFLEEEQMASFVSVATGYGKEVLPDMKYCQIIEGRLDKKQMESFIRENEIELILDATHPYAVEVSENIRQAGMEAGTPCLRILRGECERQPDAVYVRDIEELTDFLNLHPGRILVTTGSKELPLLKKVTDYQERIFARVLPLDKVLADCRENGFFGEHLIGGRGPFTIEENVELIRKIQADYLVTKDTGKEGGFLEKAEAARIAGARLVVIERPGQGEGISVEDACCYLHERYGRSER